MYRSGGVFVTAAIFLLLGLVQQDWISLAFGFAALCFAAYIYYAFESQPVPRQSIFSQLALLAIGLSVGLMGTLSFLWVAGSAQGIDANWFFLILAFVLAPMVILMGVAMILCALFSRGMSHQWLMYLVTEPSRYILPIGEISPADRVVDKKSRINRRPRR